MRLLFIYFILLELRNFLKWEYRLTARHFFIPFTSFRDTVPGRDSPLLLDPWLTFFISNALTDCLLKLEDILMYYTDFFSSLKPLDFQMVRLFLVECAVVAFSEINFNRSFDMSRWKGFLSVCSVILIEGFRAITRQVHFLKLFRRRVLFHQNFKDLRLCLLIRHKYL